MILITDHFYFHKVSISDVKLITMIDMLYTKLLVTLGISGTHKINQNYWTIVNLVNLLKCSSLQTLQILYAIYPKLKYNLIAYIYT